MMDNPQPVYSPLLQVFGINEAIQLQQSIVTAAAAVVDEDLLACLPGLTGHHPELSRPSIQLTLTL